MEEGYRKGRLKICVVLIVLILTHTQLHSDPKYPPIQDLTQSTLQAGAVLLTEGKVHVLFFGSISSFLVFLFCVIGRVFDWQGG
jgi:hypothetical protein